MKNVVCLCLGAVDEGLIDEDTYRMAKEYFGSLWNYVGD